MLKITEKIVSDSTTLTLSGRLDMQGRTSFQTVFKQAHASNPHHLIVNLAQVSFIDSSSIGALILAHRACLSTGTRLSLIASPGIALDTLQLMKIGDMIPIHTTEHTTTTPSPAHR